MAPLYEGRRAVKPQTWTVGWWLPGAGEEGSYYLMGTEVPFYKVESVLEVNGGAGCAA